MSLVKNDPRVRFWNHVERGFGCWEWRGRCNVHRGGYGIFKIDGRSVSAHRASWMLWRGPIPDGLCVCHHCDKPPCVRPDHLFLGTVADNSRDCREKGRQGRTGPRNPRRGVDNHNARLTPEIVRMVRAEHEGGVSQSALARERGVSRMAIYNILRGHTWGWVE